MRLAVFNEYRIGVFDEAGIRDVSSAVPKWEPDDRHAMNRLIAGWAELRAEIQRVADDARVIPLHDLRLRPPVPAPTHLLAAPVNFLAPHHSSTSDTADKLGFFLKATGSITGASDPIELPTIEHADRRFVHEGEIAFVVGTEARGVSVDDAPASIFGYTMIMDGTMTTTADHREERVQRKSFYSFCPMGPCIVTADELPDWTNLNVKLWLNGEQRQDARAGDMLVGIPTLLSRASHVMPLLPGDVYTTGSPPGLGSMAAGDTIVMEGKGIGRMTLPVVARGW